MSKLKKKNKKPIFVNSHTFSMQNGLTEPWSVNHEKEEPEEVSNMHLNTKWYHN